MGSCQWGGLVPTSLDDWLIECTYWLSLMISNVLLHFLFETFLFVNKEVFHRWRLSNDLCMHAVEENSYLEFYGLTTHIQHVHKRVNLMKG